MVTVPETLAPFAGAAREIVGAWVSLIVLMTVTVIPAEFAVLPDTSRTVAVKV
jgi:hypothetical protein